MQYIHVHKLFHITQWEKSVTLYIILIITVTKYIKYM